MIRRLRFGLAYWLPGKPPWDSGVSPPELTRVVQGLDGHTALTPGRALDLGCGTGTNVVYLAGHGWQAVGVDFVGRAIESARAKASQAGAEVAARCAFHRADVTRLGFLRPPFDLALDMGCLHSLEQPRQAQYAGELARLVRPGGLYLLYAFKPGAGLAGGLTEADVLALFGPAFEGEQVEEGAGWPSAWYTLRKT